MGKDYYYIYCQGILGVKTNLRDFRWIYGSTAPSATREAYEACRIKFDVCFKPEKQLTGRTGDDGRFQAYRWYSDSATVSYRRVLIPHYEIGYDIRIQGNTVVAEIGEHYHRVVKHRIMNLHGTYYLLSDLANMLLLQNGLLTLYASAVYHAGSDKGVVCFAPPNTGKTYTATTLCERYGYELVGEDVVIFDGHRAHACPWTASYRKGGGAKLDSAGALRRGQAPRPIATTPMCTVTDLMVLSLGLPRVSTEKDRILGRIAMLNGYLFGYYASPIVKILGYFEKGYDRPWNAYAQKMLKEAVEACRAYDVQSEESVEFAARVHGILSDETV
jgi:hypothetical protein